MYIEELDEKIYTIVCKTKDGAFNEAFQRYTNDNGGHDKFLETIHENRLGVSYEVWFVSDIPGSDEKMYKVKMQAVHKQQFAD